MNILESTYNQKEEISPSKEIKSENDIIIGLLDRAKIRHSEYRSSRRNFIVIERKDFQTLFELSGPLALLFYLISYVNRLDKEEGVWGNLGKYYRQGHLATLRTQSHISREMEVSQQSISNWFSILEEKGYIKKIGEETFKVGKSWTKSPVYSVGRKVEIEGYSYEIYYFEAISEYKSGYKDICGPT